MPHSQVGSGQPVQLTPDYVQIKAEEGTRACSTHQVLITTKWEVVRLCIFSEEKRNAEGTRVMFLCCGQDRAPTPVTLLCLMWVYLSAEVAAPLVCSTIQIL